MKNNKTKISIIISVVALILILAGISYAYYAAVLTGNETSSTVSGTTSNLAITFTDGSGTISASDIAPEWSSSKTFTVSNTGTGTGYYNINISNITNTFTIAGSIVYTLTSSDGGASISESVIPANTQNVAFGISIGQGVTHTYTLTVSYKNLGVDQTADLGKTFSFTVGITSAMNPNTKILLSKRILGDSNANVSASTVTTAGQAISLTGESELASTTDDYGTSYYFRGNVANNYVVFANMCWRIVRVTGNSAIKLVLYNYNASSVSNPCSSAYDSTTAAFARYSGSTYNTVFNSSYNDNAYIGFMYGASSSSTYALTHANTNKSAILTNLETWYTSKLTSYSSYLADTIWCNDKSIYSGLGYGANFTNYSAYNRLFNISKSSPSLVCPADANSGKLSKYTADDTTYGNGDLTYRIGLLTADEIIYAGEAYALANSTYYLYKNASSWWWWSMTPIWGDSNAADIFGLYSSIYIVGANVNNSYALRPAVSLVSTTKATGAGTASNPYIIQ